MTRVISLANQKGGVGKTTSAINLGAALAERGCRVLMVDFDPQGALSVGLGVNSLALDRTVYNLLLDRETTFGDVVVATRAGPHLLPGNIDLSAAEVVLVSEVAREQALKRALAPAIGVYDVVLIDCPPSLGLLTVNALTASTGVIIPLECEFFALRGMALLVDTIEKVRERLNPDLRIDGVLATMFDPRTLHAREVLERVRDAFAAHLYKTTIPRTIRFAEAPVVGESILTYAADSRGAEAYRALAREVLGFVDEESQLAGSGRAVPDDGAAAEPGASAPDRFAGQDGGAPPGGVADERRDGDSEHDQGERPVGSVTAAAAAPVSGRPSDGGSAAGQVADAEAGEWQAAPRRESDVLLHP